MKLFSTPTTHHLVQRIALPHGVCVIKRFSDGELSVSIDNDVHDTKVLVLAATQAPAEHLLELFFLLDALQQSGAHITLFITYFSYARNVTAAPSQANTARVISTILHNFTLAQTFIVHPHNNLLHDFLPFTAVVDTDFFCRHAESYDAVAAPDAGAAAFAHNIAQLCNKDLIVLTKTRPEDDTVTITSVDGSPENKKILLIDDIISTGRTLIEAAHALKNKGAHSVAAAATHGVFSPGARQRLEQSPLENIFVTNTINQHSHGKIVVDDISPLITKTCTMLLQ